VPIRSATLRNLNVNYRRRRGRDAQAFWPSGPCRSCRREARSSSSRATRLTSTERVSVPAEYESVAAGKRAGEDALRLLCPRFQRAGIRLVVVSGDMIDGTITVRLLERVNPEAVAARRAAGPLPTVAEFAGAIVGAIDEPPCGGDTVYVGGLDLLR
jgi:3-oxoacyl-[acyl-carrier protein] reductase